MRVCDFHKNTVDEILFTTCRFLETLTGIAFSGYENEVTHPWILNGSTWNFFEIRIPDGSNILLSNPRSRDDLRGVEFCEKNPTNSFNLGLFVGP